MTPRAAPGLAPDRLVRLMREAVERCRLDLRGATVFTEAATGAYAVTPVIAALAGADRVYALARPTRHGGVADAAAAACGLADRAGVAGRIRVVTGKDPAAVGAADVVTNCGHVRPVDGRTVGWMRPGAAVPLMYESWELRPGEVDLDACRVRGVRVAGTNERHPAVDVFSYLGLMAIKLLLDAGVAAYRSRVLVVCDNPFAPYLRRGLEAAGARVEAVAVLGPDAAAGGIDCILVATAPGEPPVAATAAGSIAARWPGAVVAQFWGDIDRPALTAAGVPFWPPDDPVAGHMGVLPSAVGPEPVVRLQAGGLKVGETLLRASPGSPDWEFTDAT